ncbi:hypothetical protein Adt_13428 [Abeliophyllum distichum]|uniref:Uncharacterized protein n=1 Tax=Abeliophyllum distichum TaxID=126358 RepID=A0ABD1TWR5_9LAMI
MQSIKNNAKYFMRLVGNQVRFTVPPYYPAWTDVPEEQRARLHSIVEDKLVEVRETQQPQTVSNGDSVDECDIAWEVLEERQGHVIGVRRVPNGRYLSLDSTGASNMPPGQAQFSDFSHFDNHRFAMYEAQLRRKERTIVRLTSNLQ